MEINLETRAQEGEKETEKRVHQDEFQNLQSKIEKKKKKERNLREGEKPRVKGFILKFITPAGFPVLFQKCLSTCSYNHYNTHGWTESHKSLGNSGQMGSLKLPILDTPPCLLSSSGSLAKSNNLPLNIAFKSEKEFLAKLFHEIMRVDNIESDFRSWDILHTQKDIKHCQCKTAAG